MLGRVIAWSTFIVWLRSYWRSSAWFGPVIVAAITVVVITFGHGEYLKFADASQANTHVATSFAVKWGSIAVVILITTLVILRKRRMKAPADTRSTQNEPQQDELSIPDGVDLDRPRSAAERILDESPPKP